MTDELSPRVRVTYNKGTRNPGIIDFLNADFAVGEGGRLEIYREGRIAIFAPGVWHFVQLIGPLPK